MVKVKNSSSKKANIFVVTNIDRIISWKWEGALHLATSPPYCRVLFTTTNIISRFFSSL